MSVNVNLNDFSNKIGTWWLEDKPEEVFYARIIYDGKNYVLISEVVRQFGAENIVGGNPTR